MKFMDKLKVAKEAATLGVGGMQGKITEIQKQDVKFKEQELKILEKFEGKLDEVLLGQKEVLKKIERLK